MGISRYIDDMAEEDDEEEDDEKMAAARLKLEEEDREMRSEMERQDRRRNQENLFEGEDADVAGGTVSEGEVDVPGSNGSEPAVGIRDFGVGSSVLSLLSLSRNADCSHGLASTPKNISGAVVTLYNRRYMIRCSPNGFSSVSHISRQSSCLTTAW